MAEGFTPGETDTTEFVVFDKAKEELQRTNLANHIRTKAGTTAKLDWPTGFISAVDNLENLPDAATQKYGFIPPGGLPPLPKPVVIRPLSVTENGTYTAPDGVTGYSPVAVDVPAGGGVDIPYCEVQCNGGGGFAKNIYSVTAIVEGELKLITGSGGGVATYKIPCNTIVMAENFAGEGLTFTGEWKSVSGAGSSAYGAYLRITPSTPTTGLRIG